MSSDFKQLLVRLSRDTSMYAQSEDLTCQGMILPILAQLGWDPFNVNEVIPEYQIDGGRVDYCLVINGKASVFIEVKRYGINLDSHEKQLLQYSFSSGVGLAVLTNGSQWWLYLPLRSGSWQERKFFTIDINQQDPSEAVRYFHDFLGKVSVADGTAVNKAQDVYNSRRKSTRIKETLPIAWKELLEGPDSGLIDLLADKVESLSGYHPDPRAIRRYLSSQIEFAPAQTPPAKPISRRRPKGDKPVAMGVYTNRLKDEYLNRKNNFRNTFSSAYQFLDSLEKAENTGIYLMTDSNAHYYSKDKYLMRIELSGPQSSKSFIRFRSKFHMQIREGTSDRSDLIFPIKIGELVSNIGNSHKSWYQEKADNDYVFIDNTPSEFFDSMLEFILEINSSK